MIDKHGKAHLLDLGAAKEIDMLDNGNRQSTQMVHKDGFSPPEQYTTGENIGAWTDVYAMAATIYYCVTGKTIKTAVDRLYGDSSVNFPDTFSRTVRNALQKALSITAGDRYQTMGEFWQALSKTYPPEPTVTITFKDSDGNVIERKVLPEGNKVIPPTVPHREGYRFVEWKPGKTTAGNKEYIAKYEQIGKKSGSKKITAAITLCAAALAVVIYILIPKNTDVTTLSPVVSEVASTEETISEATSEPTEVPTAEPTAEAILESIEEPTEEPISAPTTEPTIKPTAKPTATPTSTPTAKPTVKPTATPAVYYSGEENGLEYEIYTDYAIITNYTGDASELNIPSEIDGYPVTTIGKDAFDYCYSLTSITIPNSVVVIDRYAFFECGSLTSITIPDSVAVIETCAFLGCRSLASIIIPSTVSFIGKNAFTKPNDYAITTITSNEYTYNLCNGQAVIVDYQGSDTSLDIPSTIDEHPVTGISNLFSDISTVRDNLTSVTIPDSVTTIGAHVFSGCDKLTSITIPDSVTTIGAYAFFDCNKLTSITIPDSVTRIGAGAFINCNSISVDENNKCYFSSKGFLYSKDGKVLLCCPKGIKGKFVISDDVEVLEESVFCDCSELTDITIPNSVPIINRSAFSGCDSLTSITIPDSVTKIEEYAFSQCHNLTSITIPDSVTTINYFTFADCDSLENIIIPNSVTMIERYAFNDCDNLTSIIIPNSVKIIGENAFNDCDNLRSIIYGGNESRWKEIEIGDGNSSLTNARILYLSKQ